MPTRFKELQKRQAEFVEERGWEHYHKPKNIAMALSVESAELTELFQWRDLEDGNTVKGQKELREETREELADILIYAMSMATQCEIDLMDAVEEKLEDNQERFDPEDTPDFG